MSSPSVGSARRLRGERGASFVEYSLGFSFLAVLAIGASQWLTSASRSQVDNQALCVSARPAPASCQKRPAIVPTTTTIMTTTTTSPPPPTTATPTTSGPGPTSPPPTTAPPATTTTVPATTTTRPPTTVSGFTATKVTSGGRGVTVTMLLTSGTGVPGATVRLRFVAQAPGGAFETTVDTVSAANGAVSFRFMAPYSDTTAITVTVIAITSDPPVSALPSPSNLTVTFP